MTPNGVFRLSGLAATVIVALYALEHPLFEAAFAETSGLPYILGTAALACGACVAGVQTLEWLGKGVLGMFEVSSSCPVARLSTGLIWLTLGSIALLAIGLLKPATALLLFIPMIIAIRLPRAEGGSILAGIHGASWLVILCFGVLAGAYAAAPSTAHDDHVYHLQAIREFSETGTLWAPSPQLNTYRPLAHAALLAWARLLAGDGLSRFGSLFFLLATGLLIARRHGLAGTVALLVWVGNPEFVFLAGSSYVEPFQCLVFAAILVLLGTPGACPGVLGFRTVGLLAGLLPATKYLGLVLLPAVALLACDRARRADMPWKLCGTMAIGCLISLAIGAGPFYARNTVMTGNPLFPHSTGMFQTKAGLPRLPFDRLPAGSKGLIDFSYGGFTDRFGMGREIEDLLLAPWNVIMHGHFHTEKYPLKYFDGQLNPLILLFGLLLVAYAFGARMTDPTGGSGSDEAAMSEPDYRALLAVTGWLMGFWLLGSHQIRFLLPLVTLLSWSVTGMIRGGSMRRAMFWILIGIVSCTWTVSYGLNRIARVAPYLSGDQTSERYLAAKLPFYACFDWANRSLSGDGIILVLLEERTFLLRRPYLWTGLLPHTFINFLHACGTAAEAERLLRERGIEYVFLPRHAAVLYANIDNALFQTIRREFFQERLETIYSDAQCALLSWKTR